MRVFLCLVLIFLSGCREKTSQDLTQGKETPGKNTSSIHYAKGFEVENIEDGLTLIKVLQPWPNATKPFTYALVDKDASLPSSFEQNAYDAVVSVPVERLVLTSTTHIPAIEALGVANRLIGFPGTDYISSELTRERISQGKVVNLGNNESINTEMTLQLQPDLVVGFSISSENRTYETLIKAGIPVVYNGDWTEQTPLGKAEWIKFFAPFFQLEEKADSIFDSIANSYAEARELASKAEFKPSIMSGALYKDVWYAPGGKSWAAQFIRDANATYLWNNTEEVGSLSLSLESVLAKASGADFWISPSQFTSYIDMENANRHYGQFKPFQKQKVFTYALSKGETGGLTFFELGPNRPDLILKDLIHIFHPEVLPGHTLYFFKPLQ
ncbi:ABC transporter substrate-binding protein [Muriicola soli]|uniref:ABC transporter substrate-binding protein n=1 Tax=Muriicola soli TaxID=2507538 RepID=A0A411EA77_9FLAO|nr:ABC transporter substrate-binding protein [Muriicola soli]QBA64434.1 ABC transporter substrate-binding protein [Muriicola soli]